MVASRSYYNPGEFFLEIIKIPAPRILGPRRFFPYGEEKQERYFLRGFILLKGPFFASFLIRGDSLQPVSCYDQVSWAEMR